MGLRDLVLFNIAAVVGVRWLAAAAHTGPGSITLWLLAAGLFFVPSALAVAALSRRFPQEGGIYVWTRDAFGDWHGFLCGWCYWLSNLFYFPGLLLAGVGMAASALGFAEKPGLARGGLAGSVVDRVYHQYHWARRREMDGSIVGAISTCFTGGLLVVFGAAVWLHSGSATPMRMLPEWSLDKLNFWSQIAFAFGGIELAAILGGEIRNPERPCHGRRGMAGMAIAAFYITGTLAILVLLTAGSGEHRDGMVQAASAAGARLGIGWPPLVVACARLPGRDGAACGVDCRNRAPAVCNRDRSLSAAGFRPAASALGNAAHLDPHPQRRVHDFSIRDASRRESCAAVISFWSI